MSNVLNKHNIEFLKFVLERSPVLEIVSVSPPSMYYKDGQMNMVNEVLRVGRVSPSVEINFLDPW